jgi:hypothetical protein
MAEARVYRSLVNTLLDEGIRFDGLFTLLTLWFIAGVFLDGRSHTHGAPETFFTLEHGIFYTAFLAITVLLGGIIYRNRTRGHSWSEILPDGYWLSVAGVALFGVAGAGDMVWHEVFGIEANVEALLSPTHLLLMIGAGLFVSGPLRSAWHRLDPAESGWSAQLPLVLSATITLSVLTFATMYVHPIVNPLAGAGHQHAGAIPLIVVHELGVASILLQTAILMGSLLVLVRRFSLPQGALTVVLTLNASAMSLLTEHYQFIPAWLLAGVVADLLVHEFDRSRSLAWRGFGVAVPVALFGLYFGTLWMTEGIAWTVHVWVGAIVLAGIVGWLGSYLVAPPTIDDPSITQ